MDTPNPYPYGPPPPWWAMLQPQQIQNNRLIHNEVPARVQVAAEFLMHLTLKTMTRAVQGPVAPIEVNGQELTIEESKTQVVALQTLQQYFGGTLEPSQWEQFYMRLVNQSSVNAQLCPVCKGKERKDGICPSCGGKGVIIVNG